MPLGAVGAFGAQALRDSIKQRLMDEAAARQREFQNSIELRRVAVDEQDSTNRRDEHSAMMRERADIAAGAQRDREIGLANTLSDQIPAGTEIGVTDPAVPLMVRGGRMSLLQHADPNLASTAIGGMSGLPGPAPMPSGRMTMMPQAAKPERFIKQASEKQTVDATARLDKETDNARGDAMAAETSRHNFALENKPPAALKDTYGEWQKKYDYELAHPKPSAGGTQGLQRARADSAVQMLDQLEQVHAKLNAGEGPGQLWHGAVQGIKGALNMENSATEYQKLRRATAVALAVAIQGSRPSDADAEAMAQLLPDFKTPKEVAAHLFAGTRNQLRSTSQNMAGSSAPTMQVQGEYDYVPGKGLVRKP